MNNLIKLIIIAAFTGSLVADEPTVLEQIVKKRSRSDASLNSSNTFSRVWEAAVNAQAKLNESRNGRYSVVHSTDITEHYSNSNAVGHTETDKPVVLQENRFEETTQRDLFSTETKEKASDLFAEMKRFARLLKKYAPKEKLNENNLFSTLTSGTGDEKEFTYPLAITFKTSTNYKVKFYTTTALENPTETLKLSVPMTIIPNYFSDKLIDDIRAPYGELIKLRRDLRIIATEPSRHEEVASLTKKISDLEKTLVVPTFVREFVLPIPGQFAVMESGLSEAVQKLPAGYYHDWANEIMESLTRELDGKTATLPQLYKPRPTAEPEVKQLLNAMQLQTAQFLITELFPLLMEHEKQIHSTYDFYKGLGDLLEDQGDVEALKAAFAQKDSEYASEVEISRKDEITATNNLRRALTERLLIKLEKNEITTEDHMKVLKAFEENPTEFLKRKI